MKITYQCKRYHSPTFDEPVLLIDEHRYWCKPPNPEGLAVYDEKELAIMRRVKLTGGDLTIIHEIKRVLGATIDRMEADIPWDEKQQKLREADRPSPRAPEPGALEDTLFHPTSRGPYKGGLSLTKSKTSPRTSLRKR